MTTSDPVSLSDYARHRGCSKQAVSNAIRRRRLLRSIVRVGDAPKIADMALADQEWEQNVGRRTAHHVSSVETNQAAVTAPAESQTIQAVIHPGDAVSASTLIEAQRIATLERARKLRMENDQAEGRLVTVEEAAKEAFDAERVIRESILNLPARLAGELAAEHDPAKVHARLDAALREALNAAADALLTVAHG